MTSFMQKALRSLLIVSALSTTALASEYIVKYKSPVAFTSLATTDVQVKNHHELGQYYVVDIKEGQQIQGLIHLFSNPNVDYVVPNARMHAFNVPVSSSATQTQWAISKIQAEKAWQRAGNKGSRKVVVAVIDTGADFKHKNLAPNMITGYDFINNNDNPMDITGSENPGHGTHCSGIIGATGVIEGGTVGISPEVSIMPLRFLDQNGGGNLDNAIKAIDYAIEKHVDVISASWGAPVSAKEAQPLIEAIARAEKAGVMFVVAASNDGKNNDTFNVYPANAGLSNMISVAASSSNDSKPSWSNYGRTKVNLASPGEGIMSTLPKDKYGNLSGTSMATPLVAGLVALVKAQDASLKPTEIRALLQASADKVSIQTACDCRVNAFNAIDTVISKKMFISPYATTLAKGEQTQFEAVYGKAPLTFTSSNSSVGTIDNAGNFTATGGGDTTVTVTDATGVTATSYKIYVKGGKADEPGQPEGSCVFGNPKICAIICETFPTLSSCQQN